MKTAKFYISQSGDHEAGINSWCDIITVTAENEFGGDDGDFEKDFHQFLSEWYDGCGVSNEEQHKAELEAEEKMFANLKESPDAKN